jgi:ABC-type multidrug transport system fused ATPase/permease subunit
MDAENQAEEFSFLKTLSFIHGNLTALEGYTTFIKWYIPLQVIRLITAVSPFVVIYFMADQEFDLNNITQEQYIIFSILGVVQVFGRLTPYATRYFVDDLKECLQVDQGVSVVAKIFDLPHSNVIATPTGEMVQLIGKIFRHFDLIIPSLYGTIIPVWIEVLFAFVFMSCVYSYLGAILLVMHLLYTFISYRAAAAKAERNQELSKIMISEWGGILASAQSYERAHLFGNVDVELASLRKRFTHISEQFKVLFGSEHSEGALLQFIGLFITGGVVSILFFIISQDLEVIELVALGFYFVVFMGSLEVYAKCISDLRSAVYEYVSFQEFLGRLSDVLDVDDAKEITVSEKPVIEFQNVTFSYGGKDILKDVSFKIPGGKTLGLVGPSGCGKSTIIKLLLRFYKPSGGKILVDGQDITQVTGKSLRTMFSVVTQDAQLFNGTVRENIEYGKLGSSEEAIMEAAKLAELSFGTEVGDISLDKEVGEGGAMLSGGQKQRVALARAMLKNGFIYLLDEPTTGLDGVVAENLQETFDRVSRHATTIVITHHLHNLNNVDYILYLDGGHIVEEGNYEELVERGGEFSKQIQARIGGATKQDTKKDDESDV